MGDLRRENACYLLKCGILEDKTLDIRLNGGFPKRKRVIFAEMVVLRRKNARFSLKRGISEEKTHDICINVGITEINRVIFD